MKKILLIDDEHLVLKSLEGFLRREGYECVTSENPQVAIEKVLTCEFDLVVSDIRMPGKSGVESAEEIIRLVKQNGQKDIPIVFITGYADLATELKAEKLGEVVLKPFDLARFAMILRDYL